MAQLDARRPQLKDEFAAAHGCWSPMWDGVPALSPEGVPVSMEAAKRRSGNPAERVVPLGSPTVLAGVQSRSVRPDRTRCPRSRQVT